MFAQFAASLLAFACSKSIIKTPEQCVKSVQSLQQRNQKDIIEDINSRLPHESSFLVRMLLRLD